jgi:transcriptional regulator with XRE-family HTH domain
MTMYIAHHATLRKSNITHDGMADDYAPRNLTRMNRTRLKQARKRANLTQEAIAESMGVSVPQISRWESGKDGIPSQRFDALVKAYRAPIGELLGDEEGGDIEPPAVMIELLPTHVGLGGGGTGEGEYSEVAVSRALIEYELRTTPDNLLAINVEGDSMSPNFLSGDQLLVDKRKTSIAQPGAFCIWDGDGYVVKFIERVYGSDPPRVRVMSANNRYETSERLVEEVRIMGRVVFIGRKV